FLRRLVRSLPDDGPSPGRNRVRARRDPACRQGGHRQVTRDQHAVQHPRDSLLWSLRQGKARKECGGSGGEEGAPRYDRKWEEGIGKREEGRVLRLGTLRARR